MVSTSACERFPIPILPVLLLVAGCAAEAAPLEPFADAGEDAARADGGANASSDGGAVDPDASADGGDAGASVPPVPTNDRPTARTSALFEELLRQVGRPSAYFGQQYASFTGHDGDHAAFDSDVSLALTERIGAEADHPSVFGWNFETWMNGNQALRDRFRARLVETDARGGINTIHWPMGNFLVECASPPCGDNDNDLDVDPVALIATNAYVRIPFSTEYAYAGDLFDAKVDALAGFLGSLVTSAGEDIPILVRPFHEMNRDRPGPTAHWWAGRDPAQYRIVWRRFVDRLRTVHGLRNLLFVFAPGADSLFTGTDTPEARYLRCWPETDPSDVAGRYVDVAAFDHYLKDSDSTDALFGAIRVTHAFANAPARVVPRVSAIAECGRKDGTGSPSDGGPVDYQGGAFWTSRVLPGLDADDGLSWTRFAYMMTWTNGTFSTYPDAPDAQTDDFVVWFRSPATLFLREVAPF